MIKNERQYRITKTQAKAFEMALANLPSPGSDANDLLRFELHRDALQAQLAELRQQIHEYEALQANPGMIEIGGFEELPKALIQARIAAGLSQAELAARLNLKEQQIQRYEATNYAGASIERIVDISRAIGIELRQELFLPAKPLSGGQIYKKLNEIGLNRSFVQKRLSPAAAVQGHDHADARDSGDLLRLLRRIFNWGEADFLSDRALPLDRELLGAPAYKRSKRKPASKLGGYTIYAHYLALLVVQATKPSARVLIEDPLEIHGKLFSSGKCPSFDVFLQFLWNVGFVVLPLRDPGSFHGAWWRVDGRDVAVLKQLAASTERWIIDALHEYRHAVRNATAETAERLEEGDPLLSAPDSPDERDATGFAIMATLGGRPDHLVQLCVERSRGKIEWLKKAVKDVCEEESVHSGFLANVLAARLSRQGIDWWPTAHGFQTVTPNPADMAADFLRTRLKFDRLAPPDQALLESALTEAVQ